VVGNGSQEKGNRSYAGVANKLLRFESILIFSFSSCSETELSLIACFDSFVFDCAFSKDDMWRRGTEVPGGTTADFVVIGNLEYEETLPSGVGVTPTDARGLTGGGPMEPSAERADDLDAFEEADAAPGVALFSRVLLPRAEILADVERDSIDFRLVVLLLAFDMAEEGREEGRGTWGVTLETR
jgi:hypothetical protein